MSDYSAHFDKALDLQFKKTAQRKLRKRIPGKNF